ncbi:MAG TPA: PKD-like domain-containing protein [Cytophagaceae bacterium]
MYRYLLLLQALLVMGFAYAQPNKTFYIDFGPNDQLNGNITLSPDKNGNYWNNVTNASSTASAVKLVDKNNNPGYISLVVKQNMATNGINNGGLLNPEDAKLNDFAINTATQDYFYTSTTGSLMIKDLDPNNGYVFSLFASRNAENNRTTQYVLSGQGPSKQYFLQTSGTNLGGNGYHGNNSTIIVTDVIVPNNLGEITIDIINYNSEFGYLACLKMVEIPNYVTGNEYCPAKNQAKIAIMGSSVARGFSAPNDEGYAHQYTQLLSQRYNEQSGENWSVTNVSVPGDNTIKVLNRWNNDLLPTCSKYVLYGLSLANEGIHAGGQATFNQFRDNLKLLIEKARKQGMVPIVANCYSHGDYNATDYNYILQMNALLHTWDVPSINLLGALDNGSGNWVSGYWADAGHPNYTGHTEFMYTIPPSLFDALKNNKPLPQRINGTSIQLGGAESDKRLEYELDGVAHSFTQVFSVRTSGSGTISRIKTLSGVASLAVNSSGNLIYSSPSSSGISGTANVANGQWHSIAITHYHARGITLLYVDGVLQGSVSEKLVPTKLSLSGLGAPSAEYKEWFFYRAGMVASEINAIKDGQMYKSSLELYAPLDGQGITGNDPVYNYAQSMTFVKMVSNSSIHTYYIDFGPSDGVQGNVTASPDINGRYWNNVNNPSAGGPSVSIKDQDNVTSSLSVRVTKNLATNGINNGGLLAPKKGLLKDLSIATATQDYFYTDSDGSLLFTGLNPSHGYIFHFFASRNVDEVRITEYGLNGRNENSYTLQTSGVNLGGAGYHGNTSTVLISDTLVANANGEISLDIRRVNNAIFAYLNCLKIEEISNYFIVKADFTVDNTSPCSGSSIIFTDNSDHATTWSWDFGNGASLPAGTTGKGPHAVSYSTPGAKTVTLTINDGEASETKTNYIVVKEKSVVVTTGVQPVCSGSSTNIELSSTTQGTTFSWTVVGNDEITGAVSGTGSVINQVLVNTGNTQQTITYEITPQANGCTGEKTNATVTVYPTPVVVATPPSTNICSSESVNIQLTSPVSGTAFSWMATSQGTINGASSGNGSVINQTLTNTGAANGTVTYNITPQANGCVGEEEEVVVTVYPTPVVVATPQSTNICSSESVNIQLTSSVSGTAFSWTATSQGTINGASSGNGSVINQTLTNTGSANGTVTYSITPQANGCVGEEEEVVVTVYPTPVVVVTPQSITICSSESVNIQLSSPVSGTEFSWTATSQGSINGALSGNGSVINQTLTNTGSASGTVIYSISPQASTCPGETVEAIVIVNPLPTVTATVESSEICSGEVSYIELESDVNGSQFNWNAAYSSGLSGGMSGTGAIIEEILSLSDVQEGNVVFTVTPEANGCIGNAIDINIKVNACVTSMHYTNASNLVNVSPNPFTDFTTIRITHPEILMVTIKDVTGKTVLEKHGDSGEWTIGDELEPGIYYCILANKDTWEVVKLIKQ